MLDKLETIPSIKTPNLRSLFNKPDVRWKWMAGSSAAVASASMAGTVQITINEQLNSNGSGSLSADLTKDGTPDLANFSTIFTTALISNTNASPGYSVRQNYAGARISNQTFVFAGYSASINQTNTAMRQNQSHYASAAGQTSKGGTNPSSAVGLLPVSFSDNRINNGKTTSGFLEVSATSSGFFTNSVSFVRLVFSDTRTRAPNRVTAGGTNREFGDSVTKKFKLKRKLKKLKTKRRAANQKGDFSLSNKLRVKIRKLKKKLKSL